MVFSLRNLYLQGIISITNKGKSYLTLHLKSPNHQHPQSFVFFLQLPVSRNIEHTQSCAQLDRIKHLSITTVIVMVSDLYSTMND